MRIILIDNYDSFTHNLVHILEEIADVEVTIKKNDQVTLEQIECFDAIILSPGAGIPSEAGLLLSIIKCFADSKPIFGVCLGHQAIAEAFGGSLINLSEVSHGVQTNIHIIKPSPIFEGLNDSIDVGRYHSWVVDINSLPSCLEVTAYNDEQQIMALQHKQKPIFGIQFHPESILTPNGKQIIENFILASKQI